MGVGKRALALAGVAAVAVGVWVAVWSWRRQPDAPAPPVSRAAPAHRMAIASGAAPTRRRPADRVVLAACETSVSGTVRDVVGGPVAGARLILRARIRGYIDPPALGATVADDTGHYRICGEAGSAMLTAVADGYAGVQEAVTVGEDSIHDVTLAPEAVIEGRVIAAEDGRPIAAARAIATEARRTWSSVPADAETDDAGAFRIANLAPGRYAVTCAADGRYAPSTVEVTARVGEPARADCGLTIGSRVSGRVVRADGTSVAGARLSIGLPHGLLTGVAGADGRFELRGAAPGHNSLSVEGYDVIEPRHPDTTHDLLELAVTVGPRASISGRVVHRGQPVPGVTVETDRADPPYAASATTDASGAFVLDDLTAGIHGLTAKSETIPAAAQVQVRVTSGEAKAGVEVELGFTATISGVVVDEAGAPVAGAWVIYSYSGDQGFGATGPDGSYRALYLRGGGEYQPEVRTTQESSLVYPPASDHPFPAVAVNGADSHVEGVRLVVARTSRHITGRVMDKAGAPVADVRVTAFRERYQSVAQAVTRPDGSFDLAGLTGGTYTIKATPAEGAAATVAGVAAGTTDVLLQLSESSRLVGTLVGFAGEPHVQILDGEERRPAKVGEGGRFEVGELSAGQTVVVAAQADANVDIQTLVLHGGDNAVTLTAGETAQVTGVALDEAGRPHPAVRCRWSFLAGATDARFIGGQFVVDPAGRFAISVPAGVPLQYACFDFKERIGGTLVGDEVPADGHAEVKLVLSSQ